MGTRTISAVSFMLCMSTLAQMHTPYPFHGTGERGEGDFACRAMGASTLSADDSTLCMSTSVLMLPVACMLLAGGAGAGAAVAGCAWCCGCGCASASGGTLGCPSGWCGAACALCSALPPAGCRVKGTVGQAYGRTWCCGCGRASAGGTL